MARPRSNPAVAAPAPAGDAQSGEQESVVTDTSTAAETQEAVNEIEPTRDDGSGIEPFVEDEPHFVVASGRTLTVGKNKKTLRPGDPVSLDMEEMRQLLALGFIVADVDSEATGGGVAVGTLKVIGGRKPGGVVA